MGSVSVSVVTITWNHSAFLRDCLDALLEQQGVHWEVLVIDNGSTDGSPEWISRDYPNVALQTFAENRGFARALNWGIDHTVGDFVLSLNPDVVVRSGFVREMVGAAQSDHRTGVVAAKLLKAEDPALLDSTGLYINRCRRPYDRGQGRVDQGQYDTQLEVFGACGAAALYRRDMLDDIAVQGEYFDEDFFAYYEDADLAWRAQLRGWRCRFSPQAVATHIRGWGDTLRRRGHAQKSSFGPRLALRNRYLMSIKNDAASHFLADLPRIASAELPRLAYAAVTVPGTLLGLYDLIRLWPSAVRKRRRIRSRRTVDDAAIRRWFAEAKL
jgi:GT2 family glycosyltransferase